MRLFFALWPSSESAERLAAIAATNAERFGGRATRLETLHLTLAFLGEVPATRLATLIATAKTVCAAPFALTIDSLGHWRHNRMIWAGCAERHGALDVLASNLREVLTEAEFAVDGDSRPFTPHVTLVRKLPDVKSLLTLPSIEPLHWQCGSFELIRSRLSDAGPAYEMLASFPLTPG